jgi:hypothetical protein
MSGSPVRRCQCGDLVFRVIVVAAPWDAAERVPLVTTIAFVRAV